MKNNMKKKPVASRQEVITTVYNDPHKMEQLSEERIIPK